MIRILLCVKSFVSERCVRSDHKSYDQYSMYIV